MDYLTYTFILIVISFVYYYLKKKQSYFDELGVPCSPGWLLLGNMGPVIFRREHVSEMVQNVYNSNKVAKYVGAFDFWKPVYVIRDPELIKSVTIKNFDSFPDRNNILDEKLDPLFGGNLFNLTGERWKEMRNLLSPTFTSSKMKAMYLLMVEVAENFMNHMENLNEKDRKMIAAKELFTKYTNDVIAICAFGIKIDSLKDPNNDFYVLGKAATGFDVKMMIKFFLGKACPLILKIFQIRFTPDHVVKYFKDIVKSTVSLRDEQGISRPDMIQLMMDARGKDSQNLKLDISEMTAQAFVFFFGGFDTASSQMCIIAHELTNNQDVQKKLQDEIDEIIKNSDGVPTYEEINNMPYLDAVFNESTRLHPQLSFLERTCTKSFELPPALPGGKTITIQPGTIVWIPASGVQKDPDYHKDPDIYNPGRYYQQKVSINDVYNMGFGIGPRNCIGNRFAILETKILFFYLLSKFNLEPNEKTSSPLKYNKSTFLIKPDAGFWLTFKPRSQK